MVIVRHDEESRATIRLERSHLRVIERNRAPNNEPRVTQPNYRHAPRQFHQRHPDPALDREDAVVDFRELAVRQDGPLFMRSGHGFS